MLTRKYVSVNVKPAPLSFLDDKLVDGTSAEAAAALLCNLFVCGHLKRYSSRLLVLMGRDTLGAQRRK